MIKKNLGIIVIVVIALGFLGYKLLPTPGIEQITNHELEERMTKANLDDVVFIDVREEHEFKSGYIEGMNNKPLSTLNETYSTLPKDKEIVIICRSGSRSMQAAELLKENGYEKLINVKGGMLNWHGSVVSLP
ncbi:MULTISPECIES: rhodanese-like domain-containing protein [unclassified Paenibacillus]|uniref:rhodanese-like domain-containing protein n=1 Tax=unclassified Paenibacillus TaxID=185978 RepID=UPI001AE368C9|nr:MULTISPECIES: rhodanese-like domain-containing protein [unclassified Paenibacillus]MBP1157046.1 rhodanese-related sulfurtransferase [Paenibacillus sp. PvP091]MBP1172215.1 rhodanese-related sulfurtransferase [Paenibacillus sp. PvR098]MBP2438596.1 rhodanese-related sulfurtransferase [Paenibacillus sp. PvP052]